MTDAAARGLGFDVWAHQGTAPVCTTFGPSLCRYSDNLPCPIYRPELLETGRLKTILEPHPAALFLGKADEPAGSEV